MPKSKRARVVHTSTVQKKASKEKSASLFASVRKAASSYTHVFVFSVDNMRNNFLKEIRQNFSTDGRLFFGKTRVMAKALGTTVGDECMPGLSGLNRLLQGSVGLLCTNRAVQDVLEYFEGFVEVDFARAGVKANQTVTVPEGVVLSTAGQQPAEEDVPLPHSVEATVRKWGMPTRLDKGKVMLNEEYVLCEAGKVLNSNQTALLKLFGVAMAEFRIKVLAYWSAGTEEVTTVDQDAAADLDDELIDPEDEGMDEG